VSVKVGRALPRGMASRPGSCACAGVERFKTRTLAKIKIKAANAEVIFFVIVNLNCDVWLNLMVKKNHSQLLEKRGIKCGF
jgi:hypothetical protein